MEKRRLDVLLVERGLVDSRSLAQRLVMAGKVRVNGQVAPKPSVNVPVDAELQLEAGPRYVSRGGDKLAAGLGAFDVLVEDKICVDVGASTGGFSDCLLQQGARRVYAIDVGKGILHWKIRQNDKVIVMESTNARYLDELPELVDLVTIDVSFISLKVLLPVVYRWFGAGLGEVVALIKPQFEAGRSEASKGKGVIRDAKIHEQVMLDVLEYAVQENYDVVDLIRSPLKGAKGNVEFLTHLKISRANSRREVGGELNDLIRSIMDVQ